MRHPAGHGGGVRRILPVRLEEAKALSDELRLIILELLQEKPMSVGEIVKALRERGIIKTPNAIRYHLAILKDSGLVDLVRVGKTYKYSVKARYYAYTGSPEADKVIEEIAESIKGDVRAIVERLIRERRDEIVRVAEKLKPCEFCITKHFVEQVIFEIFKKSLGMVLADVRELNSLDPDIAGNSQH